MKKTAITKQPQQSLKSQKSNKHLLLFIMLAIAALVVVLSLGALWFYAINSRGNFREQVTLNSQNGVLEIELSAKQGTAKLDTVKAPVNDMMLFSYKVIKGKPSNGKMSGDNLYPAPTLKVNPGEKLIVHLNNELSNLTIDELIDPAFTLVGRQVPLYPKQLTSTPFNLHTHGLHVSPNGNSDNVLLNIPAGESNTYTYNIPKNMPNGLYWYHSHRHTLTAEQTYYGLAGLIAIGRTDGNIPLVTANKIPIRNMNLQYNYVFDREGGQNQLNNVNWPQYVSTLIPPTGDELANGTYNPKLTPTNFAKSAIGKKFFTGWYSGELSVNNNRGQYQFIPSNLQEFTASTPSNSSNNNVPANPSLPDNKRDVQFTVNGQFQPEIKSKAGQTEIWVLANTSDFAYMNVTLTETATGNHPKIPIVAQDGNPYPEVHYPTTNNGTTLLIPPASRYAIAVTTPNEGELILEMPQLTGPTAQNYSGPGILYTNNRTPNPPAVLGNINVPQSAISYFDGFFISPTQVLAKLSKPKISINKGKTTAFTDGQNLNAYTSFVNTSDMPTDVKRSLTISGGFLNQYTSKQDPKAFVYAFNSNAFPHTPLFQPRLGSVEEWTFINNNNDSHPIHIHVNDFQVTQVADPVAGTTTGVQMWGQDNVNVPYPLQDAQGNVVAPGSVTLKTKFQDYTGTYVLHCHRLNHEDNGLMIAVNVIPAVSSYAVAVPGSTSKPTTVNVYDGNGDKLINTVTPFAQFSGNPSVSMGDVNGDQILDLIVGSGQGSKPEVVAYSGQSISGKTAFSTELTRFLAYDSNFSGGVNVAAAGIDGDPKIDNIVVSAGPGYSGKNDQVKVYKSNLPKKGAPKVFSSFSPFPGINTGINIATGLVDSMSGRQSIVTTPGAGPVSQIKTYRFDLYTVNNTKMSKHKNVNKINEPVLTSTFNPFGDNYNGGVSLATGWLSGSAIGGAQRIIASQLGSSGEVKVFSSGSSLSGNPIMYLQSPDSHSMDIRFNEIMKFNPFGNISSGVRVATTSTTSGADLLVDGSVDGNAITRKYQTTQTGPDIPTLTPTLLSQILSINNPSASFLGGD